MQTPESDRDNSENSRPVLPRVFEIDGWRAVFRQPTIEQQINGRPIIYNLIPPEAEEFQISREESFTIDSAKYHVEADSDIGLYLARPRLPKELEIVASLFFLSLKGEHEEVGDTSRKLMDKIREIWGVHITEDGKRIPLYLKHGDDEFDELARHFDNYNNSFSSWIIFQAYHDWELGITQFSPERQKILEDMLQSI